MDPPFLRELCSYDRIFLTGAGGGFDIYSGIPLFEYLKARGKQVWLGNLSFAELKDSEGNRITSEFLKVGPDTPGNSWYFPERYLSQFYAERGEEVFLYAVAANLIWPSRVNIVWPRF